MSPAVQPSRLVWWLWGAGGARLEAASGGTHSGHRGGMGGICTRLWGGWTEGDSPTLAGPYPVSPAMAFRKAPSTLRQGWWHQDFKIVMCLLHPRQWQLLLVLIPLSHEGMERGGGSQLLRGDTQMSPLPPAWHGAAAFDTRAGALVL